MTKLKKMFGSGAILFIGGGGGGVGVRRSVEVADSGMFLRVTSI